MYTLVYIDEALRTAIHAANNIRIEDIALRLRADSA